MRDVAALAGVSIKTVSRVVNGEPRVSADTVNRVQAAADQLQFFPDAAAASLARGSRETRTVALLIASVGNPFSSAIFQGVEEVASKRQVAVFAASTEGDTSTEEGLIRAFLSRRVDGFIITPTPENHASIAQLIGANLPSVYVDREPIGVKADVVTANNRVAARVATKHLLRYGHRRIALLADEQQISTATDRGFGYEDALTQAGVAIDPALEVYGIATVKDAEQAMERLLGLASPPTAVFASRNMAAIGAIRVLQRHGLSHRVALIGFDDIDTSDLVDPPMSVMRQDPVAIGKLAAECLFARISGDDSPPKRYEVPAVLVVRGSGEIPPQDARLGQING
jgi:LacI family transcriptional regulator